MKMFLALDALHEKYKKEEVIIPVEEPKNAIDKTTDIKQYKRNYYLHNLQIYKERNKAYREKKKEEKRNKEVNEYNKEVEEYNKKI